jgi:hypothetical protein
MPSKHPSNLQGQIEAHLSASRPRTWTLDFDLTNTPAPSIDQTLMVNFKNLSLAPSEKRALSSACREQIYCYQNLDHELIQPYVEKLILKLNQSQMQHAHVVASDFGAFICLAAIFSGGLRDDQPLIFELRSLPLSLFPKDWVQTKSIGKQIEILLRPEEDWLSSVTSLTTCPDYLPLKKAIRPPSQSLRKIAS